MHSNKITNLTKNLIKDLNLKDEDFNLIEQYLKTSYDMNANIINAIKNSFKRAEEKNWPYTYWFFDIHETIIVPNYEAGNIPTEFYPYAKETLQLISKRNDIKMHIYTCSHPHEIEQYNKYFKDNDINFDFINCRNPEVKNEKLGYYDDKPYFNVIFEDKAGFDPKYWKDVKEFLENKPEKKIKYMTYDEKALDTFLESAVKDETKRKAIKKIYLTQLEYLIKDDVSSKTIEEIGGLNAPIAKGLNFLNIITDVIKKSVSDITEELKKDK